MSGFNHEARISETVTWLTPPAIISALGPFDFDPCGHPLSETAKTRVIWPDDGLLAEWSGRVWLNPPYDRNIEKWLTRLADHGDGVALVFARTDTKWFQAIAPRASALRFPRGRIKFLRSDGSVGGQPGAPSVLMSFGAGPAERLMSARLSGWAVNQKEPDGPSAT